jgi:hypothetical protein
VAGINLGRAEVLDLMNQIYREDDDVQRLEMAVAIREADPRRLLKRLNDRFLQQAYLRIEHGAEAFHRLFVQDSQAHLGETAGRYTGFYQADREILRDTRARARPAAELSTLRFM